MTTHEFAKLPPDVAAVLNVHFIGHEGLNALGIVIEYDDYLGKDQPIVMLRSMAHEVADELTTLGYDAEAVVAHEDGAYTNEWCVRLARLEQTDSYESGVL